MQGAGMVRLLCMDSQERPRTKEQKVTKRQNQADVFGSYDSDGMDAAIHAEAGQSPPRDIGLKSSEVASFHDF